MPQMTGHSPRIWHWRPKGRAVSTPEAGQAPSAGHPPTQPAVTFSRTSSLWHFTQLQLPAALRSSSWLLLLTPRWPGQSGGEGQRHQVGKAPTSHAQLPPPTPTDSLLIAACPGLGT